MKTCDIHFEEYDDTAGECPYCAREKLMEQSPDVRQLATMEVGEPETPVEAVFSVETAPETSETPVAEEPASEFVAEPEPQAPKEAIAEAEPAAPVQTAGPSSFHAEADDSVVSTSELLADIEEFKRLEVPIIVIIGLRQSGKTWFQMTLRDALRTRGIGSPEGWIRGERIDSTKTLGFCRFTGMGDYESQRTAFVVVDVPGEQVGNLLSQRLASTQALVAAIQAASSIILTLPSDQVTFSDMVARNVGRGKLTTWLANQLKKLNVEDFGAAEIEALAGRSIEMERRIAGIYEHHNSATALSTEEQVYLAYKRFNELMESRERLDELGVNLVYLAALLSYLKINKLGASDIGTERVTDRLIRNHVLSKDFVPVGGRDGKDCPLFVAMTKADLFLSLVSQPHTTYGRLSEDLRSTIDNQILYNLMTEEEREKLCALSEDPRRVFRKCKPKILADINSWFRLNKIDFVTTHFGYDGGNRIEIDQHPDKQFGIEFVIQWIDWARSKKRKKGLQYMATEMARLVRANIVDKGKSPFQLENSNWG
ncbi:MAG TPA: hypothetical protein VG839_10225 [Asticcacaulis sp.]|nr:hypothetical protein [Asticcacaulis sp.]